MSLAFPEMPRSVRASTLLHGSNADFVTNAYLALQRQWPDRGGFGHYMYVLERSETSRAEVLREIATSENARRCGIEFVDDLPTTHQFRPEHHDSLRLAEVTLNLRLSRAVADVNELRQSLSRLTADELAQAVQAIVQAQQAHHALLESRLNALASGSPGAETLTAAARGGDATCADELDWRHLARQQLQLQAQAQDTQQAVQALAADISGLKQAFDQLHRYATVELKRQVADYVNALSTAQHSQPAPATSVKLTGATTARMPARVRARMHGSVGHDNV